MPIHREKVMHKHFKASVVSSHHFGSVLVSSALLTLLGGIDGAIVPKKNTQTGGFLFFRLPTDVANHVINLFGEKSPQQEYEKYIEGHDII